MLAACTRQLRTWGANGSHSVGASKYFAKNSKAAKVYSGKVESPKSLARVALRKYAEAAAAQTEASSEAVVKKYNLELNKLAKLRNYDEANTLYEKMKQEGVTPNPTTYLIMFEAYLRWPDQVLLGNMLEDLKAKGIKTQFAQSAPLPIFVKDDQGAYLLANPSFCSFVYDDTWEAIAHRRVGDLLDPEESERVARADEYIMAREGSIGTFYLSIRRQDFKIMKLYTKLRDCPHKLVVGAVTFC